MSLTLEELSQVLIEAGLDVITRSAVIREAESTEAAKKAERDASAAPKAKNTHMICIRGDAELAKVVQQGWVITVPEGTDDETVLSRMKSAVKEANDNVKRKAKVVTWRDFFLCLKAKHARPQQVAIKSKEAVRVIVLETENIA